MGVEDADEQLALDAERAVKAEHAEPRHRIDDIDGGRHMPADQNRLRVRPNARFR